jgi:hypothetical protein
MAPGDVVEDNIHRSVVAIAVWSGGYQYQA